MIIAMPILIIAMPIMIIIPIVTIRYTRWWAGKLKDRSKPVIDQFRPKHSRFYQHALRLIAKYAKIKVEMERYR